MNLWFARGGVAALMALALGGLGCLDVEIKSNNHDADEDGFDNVEEGGLDCNDSDPDIHPDADELCDGVDNDCDGYVDCDDAELLDVDADGFCVCTDCDDMDPLNFPGNEEVCDGQDNDCDDIVDNDIEYTDWYPDEDGDDWGDAAEGESTCDGPPDDDWVDQGGDCDDTNAAVYPDATEVCDDIDNDCDGDIDCSDSDILDADGDAACECVDCDDLDPNNYPGNAEVCDGGDNDCDGLADCADEDLDDLDGDGSCTCDDCDDADPANFPGNTEQCDGVDNDCDGVADNGIVYQDWYYDGDGDGHGDPGNSQNTCAGAPGPEWLAVGDDCDDTNPANFPGNTEVCDGGDNDCDALVDCDDGDTPDGDGDGVCVCADCNDNDALNYPGNTEVCDGADNDCDGLADCDDADVTDADGDGECVCTDCDDFDPYNYPGNTEQCDGVDNDCDGIADNGIVYQDWYFDTDGDGHGNPAVHQNTCDGTPGVGWVNLGDDCDDADQENYPGNTEGCDGGDNDCDGDVDCDDGDVPDGDSDGYCLCEDCDDADAARFPGNPEVCDGVDNDCDWDADCDDADVPDADNDGVCACDDCDDGDGDNYPGNAEVCDGADNDCDGNADEGLTYDNWYLDDDGDGYGDPAISQSTCDGAPNGYVADSTDCDDGDADNHPGNTESCDGSDNDCDGAVDCFDLDVPDADNDGVCACDDCDDGDGDNFPGNPEVCDGADNDCDGIPDDGVQYVDWYEDADGDGVGNTAVTQNTCSGAPFPGWVTTDGDCDDNDPGNYPGNTETCDGADNDCDGLVDDGVVYLDYYEDGDGDGYGDPLSSTSACDGAPSGYVTDNTDCDDGDGTVHPGAAELCDGQDNDCDGDVDCDDLDVPDADNDGWCQCDDCNESNPAIHPAANEICDSQDNDCDGDVDCDDVEVPDVDNDGVCECDDCDDGDPLVYPGAYDGCDGLDNDCDGDADEDLWGSAVGTLECVIDPFSPSCAAPEVSINNVGGGLAVADVDLSGWMAGVTIAFLVDDPDEWVWNVGDSPTNNGYGGDGSSRSHDGEIHLRNTSIGLYGQDGCTVSPIPNASIGGAVPAVGPGWSEVTIQPGFVRVLGDGFCFEYAYPTCLFPLAGTDAEYGGLDDQVIHIGMNKVVSGTSRQGTGLTAVEIYSW